MEGNKHIYTVKSLTVEDLKKALTEIFSKPQKRGSMSIQVSEWGMEAYKAVASGDNNKLKELTDKFDRETRPLKDKAREEFIAKYGLDIHSIIQEYIQSMKDGWEYFGFLGTSFLTIYSKTAPDESDDVLSLYFKDGVFFVREAYCGGYAGGKSIEDNIPLSDIPKWIEKIKQYGRTRE